MSLSRRHVPASVETAMTCEYRCPAALERTPAFTNELYDEEAESLLVGWVIHEVPGCRLPIRQHAVTNPAAK